MSNMKKALALLLALMMVMTLIPFATVSAADEYSIELVADAEEVNAGDEFTVEVSLYGHENVGLIAALIELGYDHDVFEPVTYYDEDEEMWMHAIEVGPKFNASSNKYITFGPIDEETGAAQNCAVLFKRATATATQAVTTNLFYTVTFKVKDDAPSGTYTIDVIKYNKKNIVFHGNTFDEWTWEPITVTVNGVEPPACEHAYDNACDATCNLCGEAREVAGHNYADATCTAAKTCSVCGATEGEALGHTWVDGEDAKTCSVCGATQVIGQIVNGDFETGDATGWEIWQSTKIDADAAHKGSYGAHLLGEGNWNGLLNQSVKVKPGKNYEVSLWTKVNASGVNLQIKDGGAEGAQLDGAWIDSNAAADWTQKTFIVTPTTDVIFINFCGAGNGIAEDVYVDDVTIRELKEASFDGYITNGNFETGDISGWENVWGSCQTEIVAGRDGGSALSIVTPGSYQIVRQKVNVEPNTDYVISLYAKDVKDMALLVKNGADTRNVAQTTINGGADWTLTKLEFNTGDLTEIYVCIMGNVDGSKITCDDISMAKKGDEPEVPDTPDVPVTPGEGLVNGDFSNNDGWTLGSGATIADGMLTLENIGAWSEAAMQTVAVKPNTNYEITWKSQCVSGSGVTYMTLMDADFANYQVTSGQIWMTDTSGNWIDHTVTLNTGDHDVIIFKLTSESGGSKTINIDDIQISEIKDPSFDGYIYNGDFETGKILPWTNLWGSSTIEMVEGYNSEHAIKGTASGAYNITYQEVAVTPNTDYTIIAYSKNSVDSALWIKNAGGNGDIGNKNFNSGSEWAKMTYTFNSGANSKIWVGLMGITPGATYTVDSLTMFEAKVASNDGYIVNGTFETLDIAPWENLWGSCPKAEVIKGGKDSEWALEIVSGQWNHVRQTNIAVEANTIYKITLWAKNTNNMNLLVKDGGDKANLANQAIVGGDDWTENVIEFNTGANTTILISLMGGEGEDQHGIFDEIVMEKIGTACAHEYDNACDADCNLCGETREVADHSYKTVTVKATTEANGYTVKRCSECAKETGKKTLYQVTSITLSKTSYTYNGKVQKPTVTVKNAAGTKLTEGSSYTVSYASGCKTAGTYKVTVTLKGNYEGKKELTFKINPIDVSECTVTLSKTSYTYNGKVQKPTVTVKNASGTKLSEGGSYTVTYASGCKSAGTYKVTIKMKGNYEGTVTKTFKIAPQDVSKCTVTLSKTSYTYNGKVQKPTVTVKNAAGTKLSEGGSYTVTYATGCKSAGTYKVTIKMKGNYTGTVTKTFKIAPQDVSKCKITLSATSYTYNGAVKKPVVTVKNAAGTKLSEGGSYTVTYASGRKNVGTYKVTIKMKGNYTGTKTLTFKINPAKTSISSLTAGSKKLTVKWAKKTTQVTGYEIQYSTSKSFSSVKTKTITKNSTVSAVLTGLKAKTTYYVRVRTYKTVNGVKYYSGWTTVKSLKTK